MNKLIAYARENGCIPLYLFYTDFFFKRPCPIYRIIGAYPEDFSILYFRNYSCSYFLMKAHVVLADAIYLKNTFLTGEKCNRGSYNLKKEELLEDSFLLVPFSAVL